jgi:hypothetical protein
MPYPYIYNGIEENSEAKDKFTKSDLIRAEANILRAWLKLKNCYVPKLRSSGEAERVFDLIKSSESEWLSNKGASHADKANNRKNRT